MKIKSDNRPLHSIEGSIVEFEPMFRPLKKSKKKNQSDKDISAAFDALVEVGSTRKSKINEAMKMLREKEDKGPIVDMDKLMAFAKKLEDKKKYHA